MEVVWTVSYKRAGELGDLLDEPHVGGGRDDMHLVGAEILEPAEQVPQAGGGAGEAGCRGHRVDEVRR